MKLSGYRGQVLTCSKLKTHVAAHGMLLGKDRWRSDRAAIQITRLKCQRWSKGMKPHHKSWSIGFLEQITMGQATLIGRDCTECEYLSPWDLPAFWRMFHIKPTAVILSMYLYHRIIWEWYRYTLQWCEWANVNKGHVNDFKGDGLQRMQEQQREGTFVTSECWDKISAGEMNVEKKPF